MTYDEWQLMETGFEYVVVRTDSQYAYDCLNVWGQDWRNNNWMKSDGQPAVHRRQIEKIYQLNVQWKVNWVPRHDNQRADQLAIVS